MLRVGLFMLIAAVLIVAFPASAMPANCWGKLKAPLDRGGFGIGTKCDDYYSLDIRFVGRTSGVRKYRVYNAIYVLKAVAGGPGHGGDRLLIFDDHMRYLGHYKIAIPDDEKVWVKGSTVYVAGPPKWGNKLRLNSRHLPAEAWLLGENPGLSK